MKLVPYESYREQYRAPEGSVNFYYGRIGSGKTYAATADILELLRSGQSVYANWRIEWSGVDERRQRLRAFFLFLFGIRRYDVIPPSNFHYIPPEECTADTISQLVDCHVFVDEGQNLLDSYEGKDFSKTKRRLIQYTRHYHRTLNIIAQRTQSVQVTARAQVNRFYKCSRKWNPFWPRFVRQEFSDLAGEDVNESEESLVSEKHYWGSKAVFAAYDSKYMRQGVPYQYPDHERWLGGWIEGIRLIFRGRFASETTTDILDKNELSTVSTENSALPF
jgi:hypothetical protein